MAPILLALRTAGVRQGIRHPAERSWTSYGTFDSPSRIGLRGQLSRVMCLLLSAQRQERIRAVPRVIAQFVAFVRWLSAPEELPSEPAGVDPRGGRVDRPGFSRWLLHGDTLQQAGVAPKHASKPQSFLRSVLSHETLSFPESAAAAPPSRPPRLWRWVLSSEELPVAEPADRDQSLRTKFLARLLEAETCPEHPDRGVEHREGFFRRLLAPEQCPSQPAPPVKKGFARWLLKQEECPVDSTSAPVRRRGFWRNLFASEKL